MSLLFDDRTGRYRDDATGRFVSEAQVRATIDQIADASSERMATAAEAVLEGRMSLGAFQVEAQATIKASHIAAAVIAHGGADQMTFSRWGSVGNEIKAQYQFLRGMADDVASGRQPLNGSMVARARQYGQASRGTFAKAFGQGQQERGFRFERNVLGSAEHCVGCRAESARGMVPIGSLVPVGSRRPCGPNCHCRLLYSREEVQAA